MAEIDLTQDFEVTYDYVESILRTLPISYYTGRDIDVTLVKTDPTSSYNVMEDSIRVSFVNVMMIISNLKSTANLENHVRAILYHEISHAIMTPNYLMEDSMEISRNPQLAHDVINIFEDERIETVLKNTYYGVNFKEAVIAMNNWRGPKEDPPKDALGAFYNIVRFRSDYVDGRTEFVKRVADIINKYSTLTKYKGGYLRDYVEDVKDLFWDIAKDWMEDNKKDKLDEAMKELGESGGYDSGTESQQEKAVQKAIEKEAQEKRGSGDGSSESGMGGKIVITKTSAGSGEKGNTVKIKGPHGPQSHGHEENDEPGDEGEEIELTEEEIEELLEEIEKIEQDTDDCQRTVTIQKILSTELNKFVDSNLTAKISDIFENFLSRHKNNSAAMHRYSGLLDPRLLATRDDWRIWKYKSTTGPIKGFDKLHLNLFIDTSGSYSNNEDKTNTILKSLDTLEHKYPFLSFDLVTCQISETLRDKKQRYIEAYGGNRLDDKVFKIFNDLQYHDSFNYNIVLFDGDAFTDCSWGSAEKMHKNFGAFNSSKCSIISDSDNQEAIEKYAPQAHSIFVKNRYRGGSGKSYADMLFDNILEAMNKALM